MSVSISRYMVDSVLEAVQRVARHRRRGQRLGMVQLALAWVLRKENVASAIIGASRPSRSMPTPRRPGSSYRRTCSTPIDEALDGVMITKPQLAAFAQEGVKHR